ncbi:hypothetical protein Acr_12g0000140 [Actinidia rufa]|uniref:Uncharacterized protein n=1 Tax=Actinidia rufa TaxID=165716 RepID=A0A7J0FFT4_9ERIC|nr:hypothetical protein Acr_12g0000140 [Actinidia rufa]
MSSSQSLRPSATLGAKFDNKPLWNHVKVVAIANGGGNRTWKCNYCNKKVVGSSVLKILRLGARPPGHPGRLGPRLGAGPSAQRDVADKEAARMFYASGLPFNFARSPYFWKYSLTLANSRLAGYVPPSFDRQRRPLINVMAASSGRAMFLKALDASGNVKDAEWNKSNTPLHCMAHSLVPKYYCDAWLNDGGGNGVTWVAPHEDHEVSINRSGDQFDIEGQEELAQLSLDEPELERMTFQDAQEGEGTDIGTG